MENSDAKMCAIEILNKVNSKNAAKEDLTNLADTFKGLSPESIQEIVAQAPELMKMFPMLVAEGKNLMETIIADDNNGFNQVVGIANKEMDAITESEKQAFELTNRAFDTLDKHLENQDLTPEERQQIREQQMELMQMAQEQRKEAHAQRMEVVQMVDKKDEERRQARVAMLQGACYIAFMGLCLLCNSDVKLPFKK